jgi:hypothetical protein
MREKWYGDERDLVKWATLLQLARDRGVKRIVQVVCLVPDGYRGQKDHHALLQADYGADIADLVWQHFRSLVATRKLGRQAAVEIVVVNDEYPSESARRDDYFRMVVRRWLSSSHNPTIVFLDPDTGLGNDRTHVSAQQLQTVKAAMTSGDVLVFYQHEPRFDQGDWRMDRPRDFAEALGVPVRAIACSHCEAATDVMFLTWPKDPKARRARKPRSTHARAKA